MSQDSELTADAAPEEALWQFMQRAERELAKGRVLLPSWSKVTERARTALAAPDVDNEALARLLGAEAGLAVRVLTIANSALFMRGGRPLSDLKLAILRIGHDNLRSAVYAHALMQLRQAPKLLRQRPVLQQLWRESTAVAALARLVVLRTGQGDADAALLAGLLHNIGKLYLYVRCDLEGIDTRADPTFIALLTVWHARIGSAVARNWQMSEGLCRAVATQDLLDGAADGAAEPLAAALAAAIIGTASAVDSAQREQTAVHLAAFSRFGLEAQAWRELLAQAHAESTALRVMFGD